MRIPMCQVRCLNYLFWDWICSIWFLCHCELIHSVEESYLEGQAQEAPCLQEIPCGKLVWRWSKDGPSVLCVTTRHHSLMQKKRRRLVLSLQKTVVIQSYHWAQSESHTAGVKAPWWAHRATTQVGAKFCNMRETYQVALLGLYRGYWWYISSLPYKRAAMQHGASPNSSGDLSQFVCKISLPKKIVNSMNKNWWLIIEMFYFFKFLSTPFLLYRKWIFPVFRCAPRAYSDLNIKFV